MGEGGAHRWQEPGVATRPEHRRQGQASQGRSHQLVHGGPVPHRVAMALKPTLLARCVVIAKDRPNGP